MKKARILQQYTPQVGGREDSNVYIRMKLKAAEDIGSAFNIFS